MISARGPDISARGPGLSAFMRHYVKTSTPLSPVIPPISSWAAGCRSARGTRAAGERARDCASATAHAEPRLLSARSREQSRKPTSALSMAAAPSAPRLLSLEQKTGGGGGDYSKIDTKRRGEGEGEGEDGDCL